jgi:ferric-dicitrate binding protein FerR (iron transport regulator)
MLSDALINLVRSRRELAAWAVRFGGGAFAIATLAVYGRTVRADEHAGFVKKLKGTAHATVGRLARPLWLGALIRAGERIDTGPDARIQLVMTDGTTITLGAESSMVVNAVRDGDGGPSVIKLFKGVFLAVTGAVTDKKWNSLMVITDHAVLGVRGTTVWSEMRPEKLGVLLYEGVSVRVENALGAVDLSEPLNGTDVPAGAEPGEPHRWGDKRIAASLATVAFD